MRNSNRPSGPGKPTSEQRDMADEREEIDETLTDPQAGNPRDGRAPTRNEPSPQPRNQSIPRPKDDNDEG
jgi:hypothetical protein